MADAVAGIVRGAGRAGVFLDVDGTLAPIVPRPELAAVLPEVPELLVRLARRVGIVAVVSGRPSEQVRALVDADGVVVVGTHGLEDEPDMRPEVLAAIEAAAGAVGAWVEPKGAAVAVHFRGLNDPEAAAAAAEPALAAVAAAHGLELLGGKRIIELTPPGPRKGGAVARLTRERDLRAVLFAGDDVGDLDAFAVLRRLRAEGIWTCGIASRGRETAPEVLAAADVAVDGPEGVAALLGALADELNGAEGSLGSR
ncbi:MAG TPA: trehalose-phosphatase [Actinomycetota bacterium]|nr:trehalose-phosphatase [Actinomycetota bacterium]